MEDALLNILGKFPDWMWAIGALYFLVKNTGGSHSS